MSKFRISVGSASCRGHKYQSTVGKKACERVLAHLDALKPLSFTHLSNLPEETIETVDIDGKRITLTTFRKNLESGEILIAVQAFLTTWWFPTYFSFRGIGRIFVDGFLIASDNQLKSVPDAYLWEYR